MNCQEFLRLLDTDGLLGTQDATAHLEGCPNCRQAHALSLAARRELRAMREEDIPPFLHNRIMANLHRPEPQSWWRRPRFVWALSLAASLIIASGVLLSLMMQKPPLVPGTLAMAGEKKGLSSTESLPTERIEKNAKKAEVGREAGGAVGGIITAPSKMAPPPAAAKAPFETRFRRDEITQNLETKEYDKKQNEQLKAKADQRDDSGLAVEGGVEQAKDEEVRQGGQKTAGYAPASTPSNAYGIANQSQNQLQFSNQNAAQPIILPEAPKPASNKEAENEVAVDGLSNQQLAQVEVVQKQNLDDLAQTSTLRRSQSKDVQETQAEQITCVVFKASGEGQRYLIGLPLGSCPGGNEVWVVEVVSLNTIKVTQPKGRVGRKSIETIRSTLARLNPPKGVYHLTRALNASQIPTATPLPPN